MEINTQKCENQYDGKRRNIWSLGLYLLKRLSPIAGLIVGLALIAGFQKSGALAAPDQKIKPTANPKTSGSLLVYLQADEAGRSSKVTHRPRGDLDKGADNSATLTTTNIPGGCEIGELHAAPRGQWVAIQINCEEGGFVQVVQAASGKIRNVGADLGPDGLVLGWAPTGNEIILKVDIVGNPRVYLVSVASGKAKLLPVPDTTYDVSLSQNGKRMLYSLTRGLGYGSETWIADIDGQNARQVLADPTHIIAFARWSPPEDQIAYLRMPDSNIPFTVGDLWILDSNGNNPVILGEADAGHGYEPAWSADGAQIAFVGRENKGDVIADQQAERLISNIYVADVKSKQVANVTQFSGALTENPAWSPDGDFLAFSTNAGGGADVWAFDVKGKKLKQVTHGANARHPTWLAVSAGQAR